MSIYRKKSAVINSQVRVNSQISGVFIPNAAASVATINTALIPINNTNTISTSNVISRYTNWRNAINGAIVITWGSICWSPYLQKFCAIGNQWSMVSSDGLNWTPSYFGPTGYYASLCWSPKLKLFCGVSITGTNPNYKAMVSSNGINWTFSTSSQVSNLSWSSVCWAEEISSFCAVSRDGSGNNQVMKSSNGTDWILDGSGVSGVLNLPWSSICWSSELRKFCAVASSGGNTAVMTSTNGLTWTNGGVGFTSGKSVCWSPELGLFCCVDSGVNNIVLSSDGINWVKAVSGITNNSWYSVCWAPEAKLFCAVANNNGKSSDKIMISKDGYNWISTNTGVDLYACISVCWSSYLNSFCAIGFDGSNGNNRVFITNNQLSISENKYVPLISSTNSSQSLNTNTNLLYNANTDTLSIPNLSTTNLPTCSVVPKSSNDLINKAYLNSFVGDYTQGWIYEDWINGNIKGSLNWTIDKPANASIITSDASGHIGILRLDSGANNNTAGITLKFSVNSFYYSNIKSVKFIVKQFPKTYAGFAFIFIGLSKGSDALNEDSVGFYKDQTRGWFYVMNNAVITTNAYKILPDDIEQRWILFEIEITNNIPIFYITIENGSRQLACAPGTIITTTSLVSPVVRHIHPDSIIDVDYFDLTYTGISRT